MITIDKQRVYLTVGLPASGKTTWAEECKAKYPNNIKIVCKDDIREALMPADRVRPDEALVVRTRNTNIIDGLVTGRSVIVADTNLNPVHMKDIIRLVENYNREHDKNVEVRVQDFTNVPIEVCIERDKLRKKKVGEDVIRKMYEQYIKPREVHKVKQDANLSPVYLCDLDGTLALFEGKRSPFDTAKCYDDNLNYHLKKLLDIIVADGYRIIFVSGREEKYREITLLWLKKHEIPNALLYMRASNDFRDDTIIKREIFEKVIKDKYFVLGVFDDRPKVVRMWKSLGLFVLNVGDGNEF